jgi:hypothetical protein
MTQGGIAGEWWWTAESLTWVDQRARKLSGVPVQVVAGLKVVPVHITKNLDELLVL